MELCDGIDNTSNEVLDEGASDDLVLFFIDNDGDFLESDSFVVDCAPPEGYTTNSIDCDDNDIDPNNTDIDADRDGVLTVEDDDNDSELYIRVMISIVMV